MKDDLDDLDDEDEECEESSIFRAPAKGSSQKIVCKYSC